MFCVPLGAQLVHRFALDGELQSVSEAGDQPARRAGLIGVAVFTMSSAAPRDIRRHGAEIARDSQTPVELGTVALIVDAAAERHE